MILLKKVALHDLGEAETHSGIAVASPPAKRSGELRRGQDGALLCATIGLERPNNPGTLISF